MRTPHIDCSTTDNDIPSHTLPLHFFLHSFSLERLHIAKTPNYLTYLVLSPPPVSIHTFRPHFSPSSHGNPPTRITDPPPPISSDNHRLRLRLSPRWPRHTHRKQGHRHTHPSPARGRRNHVRRPPQQSTPSPFHDRIPPFPITTPPPLSGSATTVLIYPSKTRPPLSPITTLSPLPHFSHLFSLPLFLFFLPLSLFGRKGIPYWL